MTTRIFLALLVTLGACGDDHPIGAIDRDSGTDTQPSTGLDAAVADPDVAVADPGPTRTDAAPTLGLDTAPIGSLGAAQSWTGWVENYQFQSGSDALKLTFTADSAGQIVGHLVLGSGTPPPPATDPNVGYPPGVTSGFTFLLAEGFPFSLVGGSFTGNRLRFGFSQAELWVDWCALQTPPVDGSSSCLPMWEANVDGDHCGMTAPDGEKVVVDCAKLALCTPVSFLSGGVCTCTPAGCHYLEEGIVTPFDLAVSGGIASGSTSWGNVHFTKDP